MWRGCLHLKNLLDHTINSSKNIVTVPTTMNANVALALCLSEAIFAKCATRTRSNPTRRWLSAWACGFTSPQPSLHPKEAPLTMLIEASGRIIAGLSSSLTDVLFIWSRLDHECWVSYHSALFSPNTCLSSYWFTYHRKRTSLSMSSNNGAKLDCKCLVISSVSCGPSPKTRRGSVSTLQ